MSGARLYTGRWRALLLRLCAPDCTCPTPGKSPHPEGREWQRRALQRYHAFEERAAERWADLCRDHVRSGGNLGLALPPYTAAPDCDTDLEGGEDYSRSRARDGLLTLCPVHPVQESGKTDTGDASGRRVGIHMLGAVPDERPQATHYGAVPITMRHVGHQIVVAPSVHKSGLRYEWLRELPEDPALLPPFDVSLFRHVPKARGVQPIARAADEDETAWRRRFAAAWRAELEDPEARFEPGRRHEALLWAGWTLTVGGAPEAEIREALYDLARTRCVGEGRFAAPEGSPERRALAREIEGVIRSCRQRFAAWAA